MAERSAFTYRDGRDITGFIDGTANPAWRRAADVAVVPPDEPGAGGMFGTSGDGLRDRLTDFSRAVSGAYYFAPSLQALDELADPAPDGT